MFEDQQLNISKKIISALIKYDEIKSPDWTDYFWYDENTNNLIFNKLKSQFLYFKYFELLIQEIITLLDLEKPNTEKEHPGEIEERLANYGLDRTKIRFHKNFPQILQFAKYLISYLESKYGKFPIGYEYFKDAIKKIADCVKKLETYTAN